MNLLGKRNRMLMIVLAVIAIGTSLYAQAPVPKQFIAYTSTGIFDVDGVTPLRGNPLFGDLVQLLWVGEDGVINDPDTLGNPTGDDELLGVTHIGYGLPDSSDWNQGKFSASFDNEILFEPGTKVYIRAFNDSVVTGLEVAAGHSEIYEIKNSETEVADFGTFILQDREAIPVELSSFQVVAAPGKNILTWSTESETENMGFHIFRSTSETGLREKVTEQLIEGAGNSEKRHDYKWVDTDVERGTTYFYWLADVTAKGSMHFHGPRSVQTMEAPKVYALEQNYPNPFNPSTTINYSLKEDGVVELSIYNIRGQLIRHLINTKQTAGFYSIEWDGRSDNGLPMPSGTYLYAIRVNDFRMTRKMALMK